MRKRVDPEQPAGVRQVSDSDPAMEKIAALLQRHNPNGVPIGPHTNLVADLNIDSLAAMDLIMEIEDAFAIEIPINLVADIATVGDLVALVRKRVGAG
jgi:acyl carrier protein